METSPAIVAGGCTNPGDLGAHRRHAEQSLRQRLDGIERVLGAPVKIERYKLADGESIEFRFYQNGGASTARMPSMWRQILRRRKAISETGAPRVLAIRNDSTITLAGDAVYQRVVTRPVLVSSDSAQPSGRDSIGGRSIGPTS